MCAGWVCGGCVVGVQWSPKMQLVGPIGSPPLNIGFLMVNLHKLLKVAHLRPLDLKKACFLGP